MKATAHARAMKATKAQLVDIIVAVAERVFERDVLNIDRDDAARIVLCVQLAVASGIGMCGYCGEAEHKTDQAFAACPMRVFADDPEDA